MNPRAPQPSGMPPELQPDRPNPWGGAVAATPVQPTPQPAQPSPANSIHQLQCPHCRSGLTLRHEHIGIDGACIHCNTPIRAMTYQDGQVAIELIEKPAPAPAPQEMPADPVEVPVELQPTVPASPAHQEAAGQAAEPPSLWQSHPEQQQPLPQQQQNPEQPAANTVPWQTHAAPPAIENEAPAWGQDAVTPMFQTGSAPAATPPPQQPNSPTPPQQATPEAPAPAFPSPNGAMPWTNAAPQPPVVEQDNFDSFQAASPFASRPHVHEKTEAAKAQPEPVANPNVSNSGNRLGKAKRKPRLGFLKFIATLIILGGLGYGAYLFTPEEKVDRVKLWVGEFVNPALDVLKGKNGTDYTPEPPAAPESPVSPSAPATTTPSAPASSITPEPAPPELPETQPAATSATEPLADPVSEQLRVNVAGTTAIRQFYRAQSIEARLPFFVNPEKSRLPFDAYSGRFEALPTLKSVALQKAALDVTTGRWYGIFEVAEIENEKLHRWIAIEDENGEFKLDWHLYEQLADDALPRFLDDPTAAPREFRLAIRKGAEPVPEDNNPWNSEAVGLLIQTPFDSQSPRPIILKKSEYEALGLAEKTNSTTAKVARVEMIWMSSEYDPNGRVPVITKLLGWGAW